MITDAQIKDILSRIRPFLKMPEDSMLNNAVPIVREIIARFLAPIVSRDEEGDLKSRTFHITINANMDHKEVSELLNELARFTQGYISKGRGHTSAEIDVRQPFKKDAYCLAYHAYINAPFTPDETHPRICNKCQGTGMIGYCERTYSNFCRQSEPTNRCPQCKGTGKMPHTIVIRHDSKGVAEIVPPNNEGRVKVTDAAQLTGQIQIIQKEYPDSVVDDVRPWKFEGEEQCEHEAT